MSFKTKLILVLITIQVLMYSASTIANAKEVTVSADSAILMDAKSGRVLWGKNIHKERPMASTTKIMTCLLALEKGNLSDTVTTSRRASLAPKVKIYLQSGEQEKLGDLLYALMLVSANDVAVAIAEHLGGSVENFCSEMTAKAKELGAMHTVFETPNGLDAQNHHSTAYDMAIITKYALQNEQFLSIINTKNVNIQSVNRKYRNYNLSNHNKLLNELEGANGVKTGFTNGAGHCFVGSAKRGDMQLISVVLASGWGNRGKQAKWIDTKVLMNHGFANYKYDKIITENMIVANNIDILKSRKEKIKLYIKNSVEIPLKSEEKEKIKYEVYYPDNIEAPIEKDVELGHIKVYIDDEYICEEPLYADCSVQENTIQSNLKRILDKML